MSEICRICLEDKMIYKKLLNNVEIRDGTTRIWICLIDLIHIITSDYFTIKENYPDSICQNCEELAKASYLFKIKYRNSLQHVQSVVEKQLKCRSEPSSNEHRGNNDDHNADDIDKDDVTYQSSAVATDVPKEKVAVLHPCPICFERFSALELKQHVKVHKALKKYLSIPEKMKVSSRTRFYSEHSNISKVSPNKDRLHKCLYCDKELLADEFKPHVKLHKVQEWKCDQCNRVFKKLNHLKGHQVRTHLKELPYKCGHCQKGFVVKKNYDCHLLTHSNEKLPHECSHCTKRFSNPIHLQRHLYIHTKNVNYADKYKVLRCRKCFKTFESQDEFQIHNCNTKQNISFINIKKSKEFHCCKICQKTYAGASGLYKHVKSAHKSNGVKKLCSVCGISVTHLNVHMVIHQGKKPHACNLCDKSFFSKQQLSRHLSVHSGLKNYVCSICARGFNSLYNLQVHERMHSGEKKHICSICGKAFLEKSYLNKHLKVHQKKTV